MHGAMGASVQGSLMQAGSACCRTNLSRVIPGQWPPQRLDSPRAPVGHPSKQLDTGRCRLQPYASGTAKRKALHIFVHAAWNRLAIRACSCMNRAHKSGQHLCSDMALMPQWQCHKEGPIGKGMWLSADPQVLHSHIHQPKSIIKQPHHRMPVWSANPSQHAQGIAHWHRLQQPCEQSLQLVQKQHPLQQLKPASRQMHI